MKKIINFLLFAILISASLSVCSIGVCADIKDSDLSKGLFPWYSNNPRTLRKQLNAYLEKASPPSIEGEIIGLICPHAGFKYSGPAAAHGFKALKGKKIDTVILVGFSHKLGYDGIAVFNRDGFRTPLGILYIDKQLTKKILTLDKKFIQNKAVFKEENSIEMILPFIQVALDNPKIVILAVGKQSFENSNLLGDALADILSDQDNFVIIASTDMSHYLSQAKAEKIDEKTAKLITNMDPKKLFLECSGLNRMCGAGAVVATMIASKRLGADKAYVLKQQTSADATGDKSRVVGYLSAAFVKTHNNKDIGKDNDSLSEKQKEELLKIARDTVTLYLKKGEILKPKTNDSKLKEYRGLFVTLRTQGDLRGCMGEFQASKPLYLGVVDRAIASLTEDPRFTFNRLKAKDIPDIHIEISVLSPLKRIDNAEEIVVGKHGVLVKKGLRGGVYLPQVATEMGWNKEEFMNSLCGHKAGLPVDCWKKGTCKMYTFTAEVFEE